MLKTAHFFLGIFKFKSRSLALFLFNLFLLQDSRYSDSSGSKSSVSDQNYNIYSDRSDTLLFPE